MKRIIVVFLIIASLSFIVGAESENCFTIIAGKEATESGTVIIAHNEDDRGTLFVNVHKIPAARYSKGEVIKLKNGGKLYQAGHTASLLWLQIPNAEFADSYFNEHGVVITSNSCPSREKNGDIQNGGIGFMLRRILAERSGSAREAVKLAGELINQFGYYSSGRSLCIADANEGWILHMVKGKHWVARRVPDDQIAVIANRYTIDKIDPKDRKNIMSSGALKEYALKHGWFRPAEDRIFSFARVYSDPKSYSSMGNILRQWRGISLLAKKKFKLEEPLPFSFVPRRKIKPEDLFRILRDHYEGTEYDLTEGYKNGSPNATQNRTICTKTTKYSFVAELRREIPAPIKDLVWIAFSRPDANAFSPWYFAVQTPPSGYTRGDSLNALNRHFENRQEKYDLSLAFWNYAKLSQIVDQDYRERIRLVRKEWKNFENYVSKNIRKKEKELDYLLKKDRIIAINIMTNYIHHMEFRKWFLASELIKELKN